MDDCLTDNERAVFAILGPIPDYPARLDLADKFAQAEGLVAVGVGGCDLTEAMRIFVRTFKGWAL